MNKSIPLTHLYWFELPWDCLSGDKKKEKKKHASTIVKQLSSWPHCVALEGSIVSLYQDNGVLFLILKPTSLFLNNVNMSYMQYGVYPMYNIDNLTICINWFKNYQGPRSFVVDQVDNWITLRVPGKPVNAKEIEAKWKAKMATMTKASDLRLQEALKHWQNHLEGEKETKLAEKDAHIQQLEEAKKLLTLTCKQKSQALQAVQQGKNNTMEMKKELKRVKAENVVCHQELRASETMVALMKSQLEKQKKLHEESTQTLQKEFQEERVSLTTQLDEVRQELNLYQESMSERTKKSREDKVKLEKTIKEQRQQLKKLNTKQKMLDQVQHHLSKKKCVTRLEDVLSLLDFGKKQGWDIRTMQNMLHELKKMKTSKEVHTAVRTYEQFYPIIKDVTTVQLQQYMEAMLKLIRTFGKENIHQQLDDVLFAHGVFNGKSIREGIKGLKKENEDNIKIIQGYDEVLTQIQRNDGTANAVMEKMEKYFGDKDNLEEKVQLLLDEKQDQASMIKVNALVNDFFKGEDKDKQLESFFESYDKSTHEVSSIKVKLYAYQHLVAPLMKEFGNSDWGKRLDTIAITDMDDDKLHALSAYMVNHYVFLPPGIQCDSLHTRTKEDFIVATNIDSFYHVWDLSMRKIIHGLKASWEPVGNHVHPKSFEKRLVCVHSYDREVRFAMEVAGSVWVAQQAIAEARNIEAASDVMLVDNEWKQVEMHSQVPSEVVWVNSMSPTCRKGDFILVNKGNNEFSSLFVHYVSNNRIHGYNIRENVGAHETIPLSEYSCYPIDNALEWCYLHDMDQSKTTFVFNLEEHVGEVKKRIQEGKKKMHALIEGLVSDEMLKHAYEFE